MPRTSMWTHWQDWKLFLKPSRPCSLGVFQNYSKGFLSFPFFFPLSFSLSLPFSFPFLFPSLSFPPSLPSLPCLPSFFKAPQPSDCSLHIRVCTEIIQDFPFQLLTLHRVSTGAAALKRGTTEFLWSRWNVSLWCCEVWAVNGYKMLPDPCLSVQYCYFTASHYCEAQDWCCSSVHQETLLQMKILAFAHEVTDYSTLCCSDTGGGPLPALSLPPHTQSHSRMWGGTGSSLLHRFTWLIQAWAPISTCACGSMSLPWSIPHFKWSMWRFFMNRDGFVIATQRCLLRIQWISLIAVSFPPLPPQMQIQIHLKCRDLLTSNRNFYPHKRIRNSLA